MTDDPGALGRLCGPTRSPALPLKLFLSSWHGWSVATGGSSSACSRSSVDGWQARRSPRPGCMFDVQSRHHAWHAELWADRIPRGRRGRRPGSRDRCSGTRVRRALLRRSVGCAEESPAEGGLLFDWSVSPEWSCHGLPAGTRCISRRAVPVSDSAVIRALRLAFRDETEAWQTTEGMVQSLIRRPHDVEVVTAHQQRLEALVAGTGPGLVPWADNKLPDFHHRGPEFGFGDALARDIA